MADAPVLIRRARRDGILVEGPDARSWLQGQITQDIDGLADGESRLTLVLSPQGKVESFCRVTALSDECLLLDTEVGHGCALAERLRRFKLRVKVSLESVGVMCDELAGGSYDAFGPPEIMSADQPEAERSSPAEDERFEVARILAGVPRLGRELTERTIPQEAGNELIDRTVSFTKGCYTGQELVARLDSRGSNVPRRIQLLRGAASSAGDAAAGGVAAGDVIEVDGKDAGQLTSVARVGDGESYVALALVKRAAYSDFPVEAAVVDRDGNRSPATISPPAASRG
ncbi:MAG: YgfZ/GcvT domain-containing protein [Acidimicrobiales bacterium]